MPISSINQPRPSYWGLKPSIFQYLKPTKLFIMIERLSVFKITNIFLLRSSKFKLCYSCFIFFFIFYWWDHHDRGVCGVPKLQPYIRNWSNSKIESHVERLLNHWPHMWYWTHIVMIVNFPPFSLSIYIFFWAQVSINSPNYTHMHRPCYMFMSHSIQPKPHSLAISFTFITIIFSF